MRVSAETVLLLYLVSFVEAVHFSFMCNSVGIALSVERSASARKQFCCFTLVAIVEATHFSLLCNALGSRAMLSNARQRRNRFTAVPGSFC